LQVKCDNLCSKSIYATFALPGNSTGELMQWSAAVGY